METERRKIVGESMGTYIVGDIHGHYDEWLKLKNKIEKVFLLIKE